MATVQLKDSGTSSTNAVVTDSLSWGSGCAALVSVASAWSTGAASSHTVTGGGATWILVGVNTTYATRRSLAVLLATDGGGNIVTPTTGALTITSASGSGSFAEMMWDVVEVAEYDAATGIPKSGYFSVGQGSASTTSLDSTSIGTIAGDDIAFLAGANDGGTSALAVSTGSTGLSSFSGGSDVRSFVTGYSTTDSTPGITWNSSSQASALIAFLIPDGTDGSHGTTTAKPHLYTFANQSIL